MSRLIVTGLDTETTGLEQADGHRIIEICMVSYDLHTRQKLMQFTQRIHPERTITAGAQAVHGIDISDLTGCPTWPEVAPKIARVLELSHLAVAHNAAFDLPFIAMELDRIKLPIPQVEVFCTMQNGRWATPEGKTPSLKELCFACDVPYDPDKAHAADYDVEVMMQSFFRAIDWGWFKLPEKLRLMGRKEAA